jgi:hypothetical protein
MQEPNNDKTKSFVALTKGTEVSQYRIIEYHTRWRVEETIRFVKQSYALEDVRVLTYRRLQNMMALVLAVSYFTMAHLGLRIKLKAISRVVLRVSRRIFGVPDFRFYALPDGIRELLRRNQKGPLRNLPNQSHKYQLSLFNP